MRCFSNHRHRFANSARVWKKNRFSCYRLYGNYLGMQIPSDSITNHLQTCVSSLQTRVSNLQIVATRCWFENSRQCFANSCWRFANCCQGFARAICKLLPVICKLLPVICKLLLVIWEPSPMHTDGWEPVWVFNTLWFCYYSLALPFTNESLRYKYYHPLT